MRPYAEDPVLPGYDEWKTTEPTADGPDPDEPPPGYYEDGQEIETEPPPPDNGPEEEDVEF